MMKRSHSENGTERGHRQPLKEPEGTDDPFFFMSLMAGFLFPSFHWKLSDINI